MNLCESTCIVQSQEHSCLRLFELSCSPRIEVLPVPDNLKDRSARFGYIIDNAFQRNYYENMEIDDVMEEEDYRNRYTKEDPERWHSLLPLHLTILSIFTDAPVRLPPLNENINEISNVPIPLEQRFLN